MILQVCSNLTAADWTRACAWKVEIFRRRFSVFSRHAQARRTPRWEWGADAQRTERTIQNSTYSWYYYSIPYGSSRTFLGSGTGVWFGGCLVPSQEVFGSIGHSSIVVFTCFFLVGFIESFFWKHIQTLFSPTTFTWSSHPSVSPSTHSEIKLQFLMVVLSGMFTYESTLVIRTPMNEYTVIEKKKYWGWCLCS